jgi:hypothetical protein
VFLHTPSGFWATTRVAPTNRKNHPPQTPDFPQKQAKSHFFAEIEKKPPRFIWILKNSRDLCTHIQEKSTKNKNMIDCKDTIFPRFATRSRNKTACSYLSYILPLENTPLSKEKHPLSKETYFLPKGTHSLPLEKQSLPKETSSRSSCFGTNTDENSSISHEMKNISHEIEIISHEMKTISHEMKTISHEMKTISHEIFFISHEIETNFVVYAKNNNVLTL